MDSSLWDWGQQKCLLGNIGIWYQCLIKLLTVSNYCKNKNHNFLFTYCKRQLIRYDDADIIGVDWNENKSPLIKIENDNDNIDNQGDQ